MSPQYEKDCKMQMIAIEYAKEYNKLRPPKPVQFLEAFMLQVTSLAISHRTFYPAPVADFADRVLASLPSLCFL